MKLFELVEYLDSHAINVANVNGKLQISGEPGDLTKEIVSEIKKYKKSILAHYSDPVPGMPLEKSGTYPLSFAQRRLFFLQQYDPNITHFNLPVELELLGDFDVIRFNTAVEMVVARHDIYRTTYFIDNGVPCQRSEENRSCKVDYCEVSHLDEAQADEFLRAKREELINAPFNLAQELPIRLSVIKTSAQKNTLIAVIHHIATDLWSVQLLVKELAEIYSRLQDNVDVALPAPALAYSSFAQWQVHRYAQGGYDASRSFWLSHLSGIDGILELPLDKSRPSSQTYAGGTVKREIPGDVEGRAKQFSVRNRISEHSVYLAAYYLLLSKLTSVDDLVVGIDVFGREHEILNDVAGFFVNQLPLRCRVDGNMPSMDYLHDVYRSTQQALRYQNMPFDKLIDELKIERDPAYSPLFQVKFLYQKSEQTFDLFGDVRVNNRSILPAYSQYDLTLQIDSEGVTLFYNADLFHPETVERWAQVYFDLLGNLLQATDDQRISSILRTDATNLLLASGTGVQKAIDSAAVFRSLDEACTAYPSKIAISSEAEELSYAELQERVNRVHYQLNALGVQRGDKVACFLDRSVGMVVAVIAIMRSGAVFVPIDPSYPAEYISYTLQDSGASVVISDAHLGEMLQDYYGITLDIDVLSRVPVPEIPDNVTDLSGTDIAYLLYTSGTTGRPKGVLIEHSAFANLCDWYVDFASISEASNVLLMIPISFDASLKNIFAPLMKGATLVLATPGVFDPAGLLAQIERVAVSVVNCVPSAWHALLRQAQAGEYTALRHVRMLALGGESLDVEPLKPWLSSPACQTILANIYGPTECTDISVAFKAPAAEWLHDRPVMLGKPIQNLKAVIVDGNLDVCIPGVAGELLIGGAGVGAGYHLREDLTGQNFVSVPYWSGRVYRTGDYCKYDGEGNIYYIGRRDGQIKIRGKRVERNEIVQAISRSLPGRAVHVELAKRGEAEFLLAFISGPQEGHSSAQLKIDLAETLPRHFIPAQFLFVEEMPLTANGKISTKELLSIFERTQQDEAAEERSLSAMERAVADIWSKLLNTQDIKPDTDFFSIGGDSIFSIQVVSDLRKIGVHISVADIFKNPTLSQLAHFIEQVGNEEPAPRASAYTPFSLVEEKDRSLLPEELADAYPLTPLQEGMLFHGMMESSRSIYHDIFKFELVFDFDLSLFEAAITYVVQANPLLRTAFDMQRYTMPLQLVYASVQPRISYVDISHSDEAARADRIAQTISDIKLKRFDIAEPGLIRFSILQLAQNRIVFIIDAHHAILDGWSMATIERQIFERYQHLKQGTAMHDVFDTRGASFAEYVAQQEMDQRNEQSADYWRQYTKFPAQGAIPAGWPVRGEAKSVSLKLDKSLLFPLQEISRLYRVTPKILFLAAHAFMLRNLTGSDQLRCVVTDNGRPESEGAQNLVGLFLNVLPFNFDLAESSWQTLAQAVQRAEAERKEHRRYPFASIVRDNPAFNSDAIFTFNNFHVADALHQSSDLEIAGVEIFEETNFKLSTLVSGNFADGFELFLIATIDIPHEQLQALVRQFVYAVESMIAGYERVVPHSGGYWLPRFAWDGMGRLRHILIRGRNLPDRDAMARAAAQLALQACQADPARADSIRQLDLLSWENVGSIDGVDAVRHVCSRIDANSALLNVAAFSEAGWDCFAIGLSTDLLDSSACTEVTSSWLHQLGGGSEPAQARIAPDSAWYDLDVLGTVAGQWKRVFQDLPRLDLNGVQAPAKGVSTGTETVEATFDSDSARTIRAFARRRNVKLDTVLLSAWSITLGRLTGNPSLVFLVHPKHAAGATPLWAPLSLWWREDETSDAYLAQVDTLAAASGERFMLPLEQILELQRHADGTTGAVAPLLLVGFDFVLPHTDLPHSGTQLRLLFEDDGSTIKASLTYSRALLDDAAAQRYLGVWHTVARGIAAAESTAISRLSLVDEAQRHQLLNVFNPPAIAFESERCLHEQFEEQVARAPLATAVAYGPDSLTYAALNARANRLAHYLREQGVGPDRLVGICFERSVEMVVGMLAVLKAGGAYVPLDPAYPRERLAVMLADCAPVLVLTYGEGKAALSAFDGTVRYIDLKENADCWAEGPSENVPVQEIALTPENLAYVIYTSGSTGQPKGVTVRHRSLLNLWAGLGKTALRNHPINSNAQIGLNASITFDGSMKAIVQLLSGHTLHIIPQAIRADGTALVNWLNEHDIDVVDCTPSQLEVMCEAGMLDDPAFRTKTLLIGGEAIGSLRWQSLQHAGIDAHNVYGPTECTVDSTVASIRTSGTHPHIGTPLQNVQCYILDAQQQLLPMGAIGELHIGGAGVARGYLNRPELTAERFIPDPFSGREGARLYKTGDLGRWLPDGTIEYLGRNDFQVKVRGFRIELGEIEAKLAGCAGVREAVVLAREDVPGDQRLVAYVVPHAGAELDIGALRTALAAQLAEFMVPAAFVVLERLPLTPNGKLDRKALPAPSGEAYASRAYEVPQGEVEQALAAIWGELLKVEQVGRHDNFFELGGHSLLAVRLVSRVRQVLGRELALGELFAHPVLADLARALAGTAQQALPDLAPALRDRPLALSFAQQRLWFLAQMEGVSQAYHIPGAVKLTGDLDRAALGRTLDRIVARHEALRTRFLEQDGQVQQVVDAPGIGLVLDEHDLRCVADAAQRLRDLNQAQAVAPFDLAAGPLIRASLVRMDEREHVLLMTMHHIVSDGWSMGVLLNEVSALYGAYVQGLDDPLPPLAIQYPDYASWQRGWLEGEQLEQHGAYWKRALGGAPALLALPTDRPRPAQQDYAGARLLVELDADLARQLKQLSQRHGVTLYMTLLASWSALLARLSGQDEVVVGTPVAGRNRAELEPLIGLFVNTLALRVDLGEQPTVAQLLAHVKQQVLEGQQHQDLPFEQVVEVLQPARSLSHAPLFQTMFAWQNTPAGTLELPGLQLSNIDGAEAVTAKFDLTLDLGEQDGAIAGGIEYATALFDEATVRRYAGYWRMLLEGMVAGDGQQVDALPMLGAQERQQLLYDFNATAAEYPRDVCVHALFEQQVARTPDATALVYQDQALSYATLNEKANRLAHYLREQGVGPDRLVGICTERGFEMVIGLLATLKAGGAYVPLDPTYPQERLAYMLHDADVSILLTQEAMPALLPSSPVSSICLDSDAHHWQHFPAYDPAPAASADSLAYVIYTSGSTGHPKGAMNAHQAVVNRLLWMRDAYGITAADRILQKTPFSFDVSVWELFLPLVSGARLVMAEPEGHKDPAYLTGVIEAANISVIHFVPSMLNAWLAGASMPKPGHALKHVMCSGEALPQELVRRFFNCLPQVRLHNLYGPTECAVDVTACTLTPDTAGPVTIGAPIANTAMYLLDPKGQPVPVGVAGELHIGGVQVGRGYLNRPELTAERFIPDPFSGREGARLYKTGDLGRWLPDGTIEYLGRNDFQVKLRGFRIELGEIEAKLAGCAGVREAVVLAREDVPGEQRLVAYVVPHAGVELDVGALRTALAAQLAEFMVPSAFVVLERLPLTPNGKLDRKALPAPSGEAYASRAYEAPQGEVEQTLAAIWSELLNIGQVGRHDNFFELGGHSLLVVKLIERMRRAGLQADVRALFAAPTVASLAAAAGGTADLVVPANGIPAGCETITPDMLSLVQLDAIEIAHVVDSVRGGAANVQDIYPLAPLQEGILFHHLMTQQGDAYLLPTLLAFDGRERLDGFLAALQAVIDRHDILRTSVVWEGVREPVQVVWRQAPLQVEQVELDAQNGVDVAAQLAQRYDPRHYRIDLRQAPLLRCFMAEDAANGRWLLQVLSHHMVSDHTSLELLIEEIYLIMQGRAEQLPASLPFRNFVAQARLGIGQQEHEAFFTQMLADVDEPTAPFGLIDVQGNGSGIEEARLALDAGLAQRVRQQARKLGVSAASLMHQAWAQVVSRVSGRDDVVFGTVLFGRMQGGEGADRVQGMFINTLPLRIAVDGRGVAQAVCATHTLLLSLLRHEHAPLSLAQRCSGVAAPLPLFSSLFNYRYSQGAASNRAWDGIDLLASSERTGYPIALSVDDTGEGFALVAQVATAVSAARVCGYMEAALRNLVLALEQAPDSALAGIEVLPPDERNQLLYDFNATAAEYPRDVCLHALFEQQVARTPDATALVYEGQALTYAALNARANRLAHYLREQGVGPDRLVGICTERSFEMVIGLLATLKAGGAYVPLDPAYPQERLAYMLQDSAPVLILTHGKGRAALSGLAETVLRVDLRLDEMRWEHHAQDNLPREAIALGAEHLAYVIYTSGSTGRPKGVMVQHGGLGNLVAAQGRAFAVDANSRVMQFASFSFDACISEVAVTLCTGACLCLQQAGGLLAGDELVRLVAAQGITHATLPPAVLSALPDTGSLDSIKVLITAGEALDESLARKWGAGRCLINAYGPTEATVCATLFDCAGSYTGAPPIGRPIANTQVYVLGQNRQPVPHGAVGELYIGGAGVARGYLNRPELTAERFISDPFSGREGARLYKTGDLGRWLPDGTIEYLGRNDFQVKVRGFRIELGEIEAKLAGCAGVREAVVLAREDVPGDQRLVAYVVPHAGAELDVGALRTALAAQLAEFMVPSAFVVLERLPLTPNGKLDRKALPAPSGEAYASRAYEAPQGEVEQTLAAIWGELLNIGQVGRHDNFFELGGHSLLVVKLVERMRQAGLQADVRALFAAPTVASLAAAAGGTADLVVPANGIPAGCETITPDMLSLVQLDAIEIAHVVDSVRGGAANVQDIYPLAPLQEGILFHHLMTRQGDAYLLPTLLAFDGRERLDGFLAALQAVIDRHDILRTSVVWEGVREPVQVVWRQAPLQVEQVELDAQNGVDVAAQLAQRYDPRHYRIDLRQAPLLRCFMAEDAANGRWLLQVLSHHMVSDHTSLELLIEEIYLIMQGRAEQLPASLPFRNFVAQARLGIGQQEHEAFFTQMLADVDEPTAPFGLIDVQGNGSGIEEARLALDAGLTQRVRQQARKLGVSAASLMHQAWAQVVSRVSGRDDVVFGTVLFGRMQGGEGADRVQGMFINTLPLRIAVDGRGVAQAVCATHTLLLSLLRHEHAPLSLAQRCSGVAAPLPLFSSLFNYRHSVPNTADEPWTGIQSLGGGERTNYPVTLAVDDMGEDFVLVAQVVTAVSAARVCAYMEAALRNLVLALEQAPDSALAGIEVLPPDERNQLLYDFNATAAEYPRDAGLHELFEQQVARTPDATALVYDGQALTYAELNARANRLAHYLREQGVGPDRLVGICTERSFEMVIGLLATLKAGGAYVPLDPSYPQERLAYMLQDSAPVMLLTQQRLLANLPAHAIPVVCLDADSHKLREGSTGNPAPQGAPADLAYVIYTSGSTGQPKGTLLHQRGVVNLNHWYARQFAIRATDKVLLFSSLSFDLTQKNIFSVLFAGGQLHLPPEGYDPAYAASYIEEREITLINCAPSAFYPLLEYVESGKLSSLRQVFLGGEAIQTSLIRQAFAGAGNHPVISNTYGPTEASDVVSFYSWDLREDKENLPIGRPVFNTQLYLLDSAGDPVPMGVMGELFVGGDGVSRGYLNRPELTAERFVPDPFSGREGARLYKTGDLGRWLPDGTIEYLGRNDFQVKVRGFRIELGEIEAKLAGCAGVREAVVLAREDEPGDQRLVAYVVPHAGVELDVGALRTALAAQLAEFMVPQAFVVIERLPLTPNGKLDRKALPAPSGAAYASRAYEAPQGEVEETLAAIWGELLKVEQVGRHDNFFELGGHSLLAVQVISRVKAEFGVEISLSRLFASPTISTLEECVVEAQLAQFDADELQAIVDQAGLAGNNNKF